ncbi:MAG: hypothetical protein ACRD35_05980 [Candidatus Acidiferrales bacterium]
MKKAKNVAFVLVLVVACALLALPPLTFGARQQPKIEYSTSNADFLTITGENFGSTTPIVKLAGNQLVVDSYSEATGTIVAFLPGGLFTGSYLLEVENERGRVDSFVHTIF